MLCLNFELERSDRDQYVRSNEDLPYTCVEPRPYRFSVFKSRIMFDYLSVTHPACTNSCLQPILPNVTDCGQRSNYKYLSVLDIEKINEAYGCKGIRFRINTCIPDRIINIYDLGCNALAFRPKDDSVVFQSYVQTDTNHGICRKYVPGGEISPG